MTDRPVTVPPSFPRRQAATRRFGLGAPRRVTVAPDGTRALFLRSRGGDDPVTCLWRVDLADGAEHLLVDPLALDGVGEEDLPAEERARRERVREQSAGVVEYATDAAVRTAVVALAGRAFVVEVDGDGAAAPEVRPLPVAGPVVDPRLDPAGARVAFVTGGALHVHERATATTAVLADDAADTVTWGLADFVAAEEMNRYRGYWWSPDGTQLVAARVDDADVQRWHIADPAHPDRTPAAVAYPAAGTPNARVALAVLDLDGTRVDVDLPADVEYVADVAWDAHDLLVTVQPRDQRAVVLLRADPDTGATTELRRDVDDAWVDLVPGVPAHLADGSLVWCADLDGARRLLVDGVPVTGPDLQVRGVSDVDGDTVLFTASTDPTATAVWTWSAAEGPVCLTPEAGGARGPPHVRGHRPGPRRARPGGDDDVGAPRRRHRGPGPLAGRVAGARAAGPPVRRGGAGAAHRGAPAARPRARLRARCRCCWTPTAARTRSARRPSVATAAAGTASGSASTDRSRNAIPSAKSAPVAVAAARARRVLPIPPGPIRVSSRISARHSRSRRAAISASRPISGVGCAGKPSGVARAASRDRRSGTARRADWCVERFLTPSLIGPPYSPRGKSS